MDSFLSIGEIVRTTYLKIKETSALFIILYPLEKTQVFDNDGNQIPYYDWYYKKGTDYDTIHLNFIRIMSKYFFPSDCDIFMIFRFWFWSSVSESSDKKKNFGKKIKMG